MATRKSRISQEAFDGAVQENIEEFGMDKEEAIEDAIKTFSIQGADISGLVLGSEPALEEPVIAAIRKLSSSIESYCHMIDSHQTPRDMQMPSGDTYFPDEKSSLSIITADLQTLQACLNYSGAHALVRDNDGVEAIMNLLTRTNDSQEFLEALELTLHVLCVLLEDDGVKLKFLENKGPDSLLGTLSRHHGVPSLIQRASDVVAASSLRFELNKEAYMDANAHIKLIELGSKHLTHPGAIQAAASALQNLASADDPRVIASKAFGNARSIAKAGAVGMILEAAEIHKEDMRVLGTLCIALKAIAVNDDICTKIEEQGGLHLFLTFLQASISRQDALSARACLGLLGQLSGNDGNKDEVVRSGGVDLIVSAANVFMAEPSVVQECFALLTIVCLRSPTNASATLAAGAMEVCREAMEVHASIPGVQRQAARMIRNMAVRNPENRPLIIELGVVPLLRNAKARHKECRDAVAEALRDLGYDDYND